MDNRTKEELRPELDARRRDQGELRSSGQGISKPAKDWTPECSNSVRILGDSAAGDNDASFLSIRHHFLIGERLTCLPWLKISAIMSLTLVSGTPCRGGLNARREEILHLKQPLGRLHGFGRDGAADGGLVTPTIPRPGHGQRIEERDAVIMKSRCAAQSPRDVQNGCCRWWRLVMGGKFSGPDFSRGCNCAHLEEFRPATLNIL